ncbi:MAG TPA: flagellar hook-basal body complex protein FliE [Caulobacteraceae bacterium]|nr:flagellar hook-basal body complex protein FliE [Caulobacteraceae bacterium]
MVAPLIAAKAYAAVQEAAAGAGAAGVAGPAAGPDFGQMVNQVIGQTVKDSRNAEAQMTAQVQGKANLVDVVTAISSAQTSLSTMIAVRDQMIASYQQIMNMAI